MTHMTPTYISRVSRARDVDNQTCRQKRHGLPEEPERIFKGQVYTLAGTADHVKRNLEPTVLLIWQSRCADCGQPFQCKTPRYASKFSPNRRCPSCAKPGRRVVTEASA